MVVRRASKPLQKRRSRLFLPALFVTFAALGSALGLATPVATAFARSAPPAPTSAKDAFRGPLAAGPAPLDLSDVTTHTAFPRLNPDQNAGRAWLLAEGPEPTPGDGRRYVTFTFDDGPFLETTPAILRVLSQRKVKATFFVVGQYLEGSTKRDERSRQVLRDIAAAGHTIGNHTKDHRLLPAIPRSEAVAQIDENSDLIEHATGKRPMLFRPPYGELDTYTRGILHDRGLELVLWSVETADMKNDDPDEMVKSLRQQIELKGGGIVLLHDIRPTTLPTLKGILEYLHRRRWRPEEPEKVGYQVVDLATYFALTAASPRPYPSREALENARREAYTKRHPGARPPAPPAKARSSEGRPDAAGPDETDDAAGADRADRADDTEDTASANRANHAKPTRNAALTL